MIKATLDDARNSVPGKRKYCTKGIRLFCQKYGIDYQDFRLNGVDIEILIATGDSMALAVVEVARGRWK